MARRVQLPESKIRRRRRVRRVRLLIMLGIALLLLLGVLIGLSWLPFIRIHAVEVEGLTTLSTSTVEQFAREKIDGRMLFVIPRNNIFLYPKAAIIAGVLHEFPKLNAVNIHAENFETILLTGKERETKALWCGETNNTLGDCRLMDETGFVFEPDLSLNAPSYVRYMGAASTSVGYTAKTEPLQYLTPVEFAALAALIDALSTYEEINPVTSVFVDEHRDVYARFANNFVLIFALKDVKGDVYQRFTLALASQPFLNKKTSDFEYLDLRFGDKLYYKER
jgi:hypothetical protein